jgi:hypothetical protein
LIGGIFCVASRSADLIDFPARWNWLRIKTFPIGSIGWWIGCIRRAAALAPGGFMGGMRNISARLAGHRFNWFPTRSVGFAAGRFPMPAGDDHTCGVCLERAPRFAAARAWACYPREESAEHPLRQVVHKYKYGRKVALANRWDD